MCNGHFCWKNISLPHDFEWQYFISVRKVKQLFSGEQHSLAPLAGPQPRHCAHWTCMGRAGASTEDPLSTRSLIWGRPWCGNGTRSPRRSLGTSWSLWDAVVGHAYHPTVVIHATEPAPVVVTFDLHPKVLFLLFSEWISRLISYYTLCLYAKMIFLWNKLGFMKFGWKLLTL